MIWRGNIREYKALEYVSLYVKNLMGSISTIAKKKIYMFVLLKLEIFPFSD